nr:hypothetical protein [uncultured Pedobacter sp.]
MAIIEIDGFKVYLNLNGTKSIIINSDYIDECMAVYTENQLDGVAITISHGYRLQNVNFLSKYPDIKNLSISEGIDDIRAIHALSSLESLIVSGSKRSIDFSYFPLLKKLNIEWSSSFSDMDKCLFLSDLRVVGYNPKSKDCLSIAKLSHIKRLKIAKSPIHTLNGLDEFYQLEELELDYCSKLETLCCLEGSMGSLVSLLFNHCKSIVNHSYVMKFYHLTTLAYNNCGMLPSIEFILKMNSLNSFRFVGTDVVDGDMAPCIGIEYAAFSNKKHFSHTMEEIKSLSNT